MIALLVTIGAVLVALPSIGDMLRSMVDFLAKLIADGLVVSAVALMVLAVYSHGKL